MRFSSKLRRIRNTKNLLLLRGRELHERTQKRLYIVATHADADHIKARHVASDVTWQPMIIICKPPKDKISNE